VSTERLAVAVVGAGAAGLAAGHALHAAGREFRIFEAAPRAGGVMQTLRSDGFLIEAGPSTFRVTGAARAVLRAAGVEGLLRKAAPESRARYLLRPEGLVPVPLGPGSLITTPLLSPGAKLRMLAEPFVRRHRGGPETVADFVARRLGPEVVDALVGPFLVGVYAGDERALGADAVFPSLVGFEERSGSIVGGALRQALARTGEPGLPGTFSTADGLGALADALAAPLGGDSLLTDSPVRALEPDGDGWVLLLEGETVRADAVVLATEAPAAGGLLATAAPEAAALCRGIAYAPMVSVALDVDPVGARHAVEGFGFLVPRDLGIDLLGALFMSRLFPGRAPAGRELVTAMIGGLRWPEAVDAPEDEILRRVEEGLERSVGPKERPRLLQLRRWRTAVPQPSPGHPERVRAARAALAGLPPLALCGSYLDGVSVPDTLISGWNAGRSIG